ncbi:extracellular solute-binding protein [Roseospira goensis]|uniref:Spermidine/putrescine transport system substrate-binding protein n=1 Tax=Roseospira goensis TaxID=391922 RepID=A0A7W6WLQ2_9PROT|nr:extracellular solute-binding protein [Roseospira goensis]MBB4287325.1 spermidine/putrescine transport system substrate-binding protein [Roseospira goensis]
MDDTKRYERLLERYRNGDIDRRGFLGLIGAAGLAAGLVGGPMTMLARQARAATPDQVRFDGWGGVVSEAFREYAFEPYTAKTGIAVVDGTFGGADEYLARVKASQPGEFNIAHLSGVFDYARYHNLGLSTTLNEDNIPNLKLVITALMDAFRPITGGALSAAPYDYGTTGIAYNRKHVSDDEARAQGANLLVNPDFKGKIGGWGEWKTRIWYAALQTGQDPNGIEDMDAVWDKLREHRDLLLKYWNSGAELMSLLAEEEIYVTEAWSGRVKALQEQGHDIGYLDPPGGLAWQECLFVIKGSPMAACEELLNFMLEPEVAIAVAEGQNYPPALDPTKVELTDKVRALPAFDPTGTLESLNFFDPDYWNSHEGEWSKTFGRVQKGY